MPSHSLRIHRPLVVSHFLHRFVQPIFWPTGMSGVMTQSNIKVHLSCSYNKHAKCHDIAHTVQFACHNS